MSAHKIDPELEQYKEEKSREALEIAFAILKPIFIGNKCSDSDVAKATLQAIGAVEEFTDNAASAWRKRFADDDDRKYVVFYSATIVSSALWAASAEYDDVDDVHPESQGGVAFMGFAQAIQILTLLDQVRGAAYEVATGEMVDCRNTKKALAEIEEWEEDEDEAESPNS